MAIIWRREVEGVVHEVRTAGASLRLYTGGVFHSQYNPNHPVGGNVWDLLMLPAFFLDPGRIRRALILGVGGGAVMRQLEYFLSPATIIGVDINPRHLYIAKRFFKVRGKPYTLVEADAIEWVKEYRGEPFDLIIEDLYGESAGHPVRAAKPDSCWLNQQARLLTGHGALVMNFVDWQELKASAWFDHQGVRQKFPQAWCMSMNAYDNTIGVFLKKPASRKEFAERLDKFPDLDSRRKSSRLQYRLKAL